MAKMKEDQHQKSAEIIREMFLAINEEFLNRGVNLKSLKKMAKSRNHETFKKYSIFYPFYFKKYIFYIFIPLTLMIIIYTPQMNNITQYIYERRCLIPNNYLVWEFTRPVSDCNFCKGIDSALILPNLTREEFKPYAYSSRPIVIKGAAKSWRASKDFSLKFFHDLYESIEGAYDSFEEECQFLPFKSNFSSLRDVLTMSDRRARNVLNESSWYVGWKNCHPQVVEIMKEYYESPNFFPLDAEIPQTNYIFLGYHEGALMHLDYIPRLMWQGQIIGKKIWTVAPTPECDHICSSFSFSVDTGDIILLDTRIWYHKTYVSNDQLSLTITSEYG
ncbi:uncharacterized protein [Chelonus insularis]|uniref:uncharacterized protein n=1 Tax=Chelonus insularis TaxID=460826 RepID=UPI00158B99EF|nr:uncharacterized protein LOC118074390 [Chelonus insularis]